MNISDLMSELARLWPQKFANEEQAIAWTKQYAATLRPFIGAPLATGWRICMDNWTRGGTPPLPAEIRAHCRLPDREAPGPVVDLTEPPVERFSRHPNPRERQRVDEWARLVREGATTAQAWQLVYGRGFPHDNPYCRNSKGHLVLRHECTREEQEAYDAHMRAAVVNPQWIVGGQEAAE